jgi:Phosphoglycerate dehydrogenase and related dehydrogenases
MSRSTRVLITPRSLTEGGLDAVRELDPLRHRGFELVSVQPGRLPTEDELLDVVPGCVAWLAGVERISDRVLRAATDLRVISRNGTGTDSIDMAAAERAGVSVERAAGANAQGVAELTLALTLCALRHVSWTSAALREGRWERSQGSELAGCTVGVVGLGAVGLRVAEVFATLGSDVVAHDPFVSDASVRLVSLDELLATSQVVSLHCPASPDGHALIDASRLAVMARATVLINTARSSLVDDDAVLAALQDGSLAAYAVDAFDSEPPEVTALLRHPHVIATPHLGGYTRASVRRATTQAVDNLLAVLDRG